MMAMDPSTARLPLPDVPPVGECLSPTEGGAGISNGKDARRVAIVHYWLVTMRGGEKVVEELCRLYPQAEIFTLVVDREKLSPFLQGKTIHTSFLQKIPGATKRYQKLLPLMPFALEQFDLTGFDIVLSSESGPAKGVVTRPDAVHVCYCHSPMRYVWDHYHVYRRDLGRVGRSVMTVAAPLMRIWDVTTAARVDRFVANSAHVARRIRRFYGRTASVVHPPVAVEDFGIAEERGDFYLCAGQLVGYKRVDLAVRACTETNRKLVVIGEGPRMKELRRLAGPTVTFLGFQPFDVLKDHLARCRALLFPGEEDFGILPIEAMASGRPVIAYDRGGAVETVRQPEFGIRFAEQTVTSLTDALDRYEAREAGFDAEAIRQGSLEFGPKRFRDEISAIVEEMWDTRTYLEARS